jgi:hypothetical protein
MLQVNQLIGFGAGGGGGPIEFVGGAITGKAGGTVSSNTVALSSGLTGGIASFVSNGDLVIAAFGTAGIADRTLSIKDGATNDYTLIGSELYVNSTNDTNLRVAYKFVNGDTGTVFGPTGSSDEGGVTTVFVFRNVDQTTPLDVTVTTASDTNAIRPNPPPITPVTAGAFIVAVGSCASASTTLTSGLSGFLTAVGSDVYDGNLGIGYYGDWTSGAYDPAAFGGPFSNTGDTWAAMTIALRPA